MPKNNKSKFPAKEEVMQALSEDETLKGFEKYALVVEFKKMSKKIGVIKGELFQNDEILLKGKMIEFPETQPESFDWNILKVGESYFLGYSLDYKGETLAQLIKQGLKKSIKEGRFPFLLK